VAVLLGWFLAHEPLTMRVALASVAILGAIVLIRRGEQSARTKLPGAIPQTAKIRGASECA
jgi:drug/metabolite transporter (DMT)-like permease